MPTDFDWRTEFAAAETLTVDSDTTAKAARGRRLEKIFHSMLDEAGLDPRLSYRPTGEEVDGSFFISGRTMLLESSGDRTHNQPRRFINSWGK